MMIYDGDHFRDGAGAICFTLNEALTSVKGMNPLQT